MDFEEDIRQFVLKNLPHEQQYTKELAAKTAAQLLIMFWNWQSRLIAPKPRQVHQTKTLTQNPLATDPRYQPALEEIIFKLRVGVDVTRHLSRDIWCGYKPHTPTRKQRRPDLDLLLNDWGVHHLHLSTALENHGFVSRTGPLLFAMFRPNAAYLVDIVDHGGWTREHVFKTAVSEWSDQNLFWELKGVMPPRTSPTDMERAALRKNYVTAPFSFQGKTYMAAGGLTFSGVSLGTIATVQHLLKTLKAFRLRVEDDPSCLARAAAHFGGTLPPEPDLHFQFFTEGGYGVVDLKSGIRFSLTE